MATMVTKAGPDPDFIIREQRNVISRLAQDSKKGADLSDPTTAQKDLLGRLDTLLTCFETEVKMTSEFKMKTNVDKAMETMFSKPEYHFPKPFADRAEALHWKWKAENWGAPVVKKEVTGIKRESDDEVMEDARPKPKRPRTTTQANLSLVSNDGAGRSYLRLPPGNHLIWGNNGIMRGLCIQKGDGRKDNVFDPRYADQKRNAKVYGHNGLKVGDWFPQLKIALFKGAHGHPQAGTSGNQVTGAYSVIVSGTYEALDKDERDRLYYSGSGSMKNRDAANPAASTPGTLALHASFASGKPVRVIRTSSGRSKYRPSHGFRYDGLYEVVDVLQSKNQFGGMIEQFKLVRLEGQKPIDRFRPNGEEIRQFDKIADGFPRDRSVQ